MGIFIVVVLLATMAVTSMTKVSPEIRKLMAEFTNACLSETKATNEMVERAMNNEFSNDIRLKKFLVCTGKKSGYIDECNNFDKEALKNALIMMYGFEDKMDKIVQECLVDQGNALDTAFELVKCYHAKIPVAELLKEQ
ncbi:unnamed protein product [Ceutorhynchus assimilis]|uniref:Uncharacterized protein n=1 Tax=Ceutorhynchus assimilis TaxID=467358 RepID=A0A9N9MJN5_9CUCU|nr:unnamed protein product [Ceutorhynchus assimilis]